jgi:alkyl sulfatase BDS1-like metallo-beta-lactamase superfamily hydrolase
MREGEQHDVRQFVSDFLEHYKMLHDNALNVLTNEVMKRLSPAALQIPVALASQRKVGIRFAENENITSVIAGFVNFYDLDEV